MRGEVVMIVGHAVGYKGSPRASRVAGIAFVLLVAFVLAGCTVATPDVKGMTVAKAASALEAAGFQVGSVTEVFDPSAVAGTVVAQTPSAGGRASKGAAVSLVVSKGAEPSQVPPAGPDMVQVPDISGMIDPDPVLKKAGLTPEGIAIHGPIESDAADIGQADRQDPPAGTLVPKGTTVTYHFWWESQ
jgi:beta-lactam-binding protein with PASTA domain